MKSCKYRTGVTFEVETAPVAKRLLTVTETARALSIGRSTLYGRIKAGDIRTCTIGDRRLVSVEALDEYVHALEQSTS
jgi:excisionase family DNA binding protein